MTWIGEHRRIWRMAVLILLVVSFVGPWTGDGIHVPAEYNCTSLIYLRTERDMCDMVGVIGIATGVLRLVDALVIRGTLLPTDLIQELLFLGSFVLLVLPFFTTLLLTALAKRRHKFHILAWGAAVIVYLLLGLYRSFPPSWMWGMRLYIWVAAIALALELTAFVADGRFGLTLAESQG